MNGSMYRSAIVGAATSGDFPQVRGENILVAESHKLSAQKSKKEGIYVAQRCIKPKPAPLGTSKW